MKGIACESFLQAIWRSPARWSSIKLSSAPKGQALIGGTSRRGQVRDWFAPSMLPN